MTEFSVLIGRVSTGDAERLLQVLDALAAQRDAPEHEVIVADRRDDGTMREAVKRFPRVRVLRCPPDTSLPALRAAALAQARGRWIAVTEDHCIPPPDWLAAMARVRDAAPGAVAVGGAVENGVADTAFDRATFLCEYAALLTPVHDGPSPGLPGMNVAYDRAALGAVSPAQLGEGFWETTLHPALRASGRALISSNAIRIVHAKRFGLALFIRQRYLYSRHFAGTRFARGAILRRAVACAACVVLPALVLTRIVRHVRAKGRRDARLAGALPWLALFALIWAWGEAVGYALGPGDALAQIE